MSQEGLVRVTSITISIGEKRVELTTDQARVLRDELQELLGPRINYWPNVKIWESPPVYCDPNSERWPEHWSITYGPLSNCAALTIHA